jgi:hypothetical protein
MTGSGKRGGPVRVQPDGDAIAMNALQFKPEGSGMFLWGPNPLHSGGEGREGGGEQWVVRRAVNPVYRYCLLSTVLKPLFIKYCSSRPHRSISKQTVENYLKSL